jgi:hypothetical protein
MKYSSALVAPLSRYRALVRYLDYSRTENPTAIYGSILEGEENAEGKRHIKQSKG